VSEVVGLGYIGLKIERGVRNLGLWMVSKRGTSLKKKTEEN